MSYRLIIAFFCAALYWEKLFPLPSGATAAVGDVNILKDDSLREMVIESSRNSVVHWEDFSIAFEESVRCSQTDSASFILHRVVGPEASHILGHLLSNGNVYVINPNGVVIGPDAQIVAAGFIASTFDLLNASSPGLDGLHLQGESSAKIANLGTIHCPSGDIFLIARSVENRGSLTAPLGTVGIGCGQEVYLRPEGRERVWIKTAVQATEQGDQALLAEGGAIQALSIELKAHSNPYCKAIRAEGNLEAIAVLNEGGEIFLAAPGGLLEVQGDLRAQKGEQGGALELSGAYINVLEGSSLDVSAPRGGGSIHLGECPSLAQGVYIDPKSLLLADALNAGNGGEIVVWSEKSTACLGSATAVGGALGGDGGFIEISSNGSIMTHGASFRTIAPHGKAGELLFDPCAVTISGAATTSGVTPGAYSGSCPGGGGPISYDFDSLSSANINTHLLTNDLENYLNNCGNVTIDAGASGTAANGSISVTNATIAWSAANSLTLKCTDADLSGGTPAISITNSTIHSTAVGSSATLLFIDGEGTGNGQAFYLDPTSTIQTADGGISIVGVSTGTDDGSFGVYLDTGSLVESTNGAISVMGTGAEAGVVPIGTIQTTTAGTTGTITITGNATSTPAFSGGIFEISVIQTAGSDIAIRGTGGLSGILADGGMITTTTGNVSLNGSMAANGALLVNLSITTSGGTISITGTSSDNSTDGVTASNWNLQAGNGGHIEITGSGLFGINFSGGTSANVLQTSLNGHIYLTSAYAFTGGRGNLARSSLAVGEFRSYL